MKKFFLSLAVMLSAATMNVNAMSNSWIFNYTPQEISDMFNNNENVDGIIDELIFFGQEIKDEHNSLFDSYCKAVRDLRIADAVTILNSVRESGNYSVDDESECNHSGYCDSLHN